MKLFARIILVLAIIVLLIGIGGWVYLGQQAKQQTIAAIESLNAEMAKPSAIPGQEVTMKLTYERIARAWLSPHVTVRLINPVIEIQSKMAVQQQGAAPVAPSQAAATVNYTGTWKLNGHVDLIRNYLSKTYRVKTHGSDTQILQLGTQALTIENKDIDIDMRLTAGSYKEFFGWEKLTQKQPLSADSVKKISIDVGPALYTVVGSGQPALTSAGGHFSLLNHSAKTNYDFTVEMVVKDIEMTGEMTQFMNSLMKTVYPAYSSSLANAGKSNMDLAFTVRAPKSPTLEGEMVFKMPRATFSNNFSTYSQPTDIAITRQGGKAAGHIKTKATLTMTPEGGRKTQENITQMTQEMLKVMPPKDPSATIDPALLNQRILEALPTLSTLGPVIITIDTTFDVDQAALKGKIDIADLSIEHQRWGLKLTGTADASGPTPQINQKLACKKCEMLVYDLMAQAIQSQAVMALLDPSYHAKPLDQQKMNLLNELLVQFAQRDADGTLNYTITTTATPGDIQVNGKPAMLLMMQAMQIFAPPPPAAAPAPVPKPVPQKKSKAGAQH